jgi:hypothetical protein
MAPSRWSKATTCKWPTNKDNNINSTNAQKNFNSSYNNFNNNASNTNRSKRGSTEPLWHISSSETKHNRLHRQPRKQEARDEAAALDAI